MKKAVLILLFIPVFGTIHAQQNEYYQRIEEVEKEIAKYIENCLPSFEIPAKDLAQIKKNANLENQSLTEDELQKSLAAYKKYLLRVDFFDHFPF